MTPFSPPNIPLDINPAHYSISVWESLRPLLRFHGYRLITRRDTAQALAESVNRHLPEKWVGPAQDDDDLHWPFPAGAIFQGFRLSDSKDVVFKIIDTSKGDEVRILSHLKECDPMTSQGFHKKVVPILEIIELTATLSIAVTEEWGIFYCYYDDPADTWEEFAEFGCQVLEGLAFLHAHRIAHLDISGGNILPSPSRDLYPQRLYSFIDFGQSSMFAPSLESCLVKGDVATHKAPEMSKIEEYDPFKADVWQIGHFLSLAAKENSFETEGLPSLLSRMKHPIPTERPTPEEAFVELKSKVPSRTQL
ncbi:kinase-like domain-containing protein [Mycena metata]|uniref:Kinase-like domain-containing protein n=1 Tax=Mycena metata TaxID=1033252 RepID=A0AAD7IUV0_9AGAR|nr:kinase-like domain-containing protein [Mycena metata]